MTTNNDITAIKVDRDGVGRRLLDIYATFVPGEPEGLLLQEETIVKLVNRYTELSETIAQSEAAQIARANILAGWKLVQEIREGDVS